MLATLYTAVPLPFEGMRKGLHKNDPQAVLARNLRAAFKARGLSARGVADSIGGMSNTTVSHMLRGTGNPQLEGLIAVSEKIGAPLWQLLCPGIETSHLKSEEIHSLLEDFLSLSELGRKRMLRQIRGEAALEQLERVENAQNVTETST